MVFQTDEVETSGGKTVVTNTKHMSEKWEPYSKCTSGIVQKRITVGRLVKVADPYYRFFKNNCQHAVEKMYKAVGLTLDNDC